MNEIRLKQHCEHELENNKILKFMIHGLLQEYIFDFWKNFKQLGGILNVIAPSVNWLPI